FVFDDDPWDSVISFAPGMPVYLDGMLQLGFAEGVAAASQIGRTIQLFDWTGVSPAGELDVISPHAWDPPNLMTSGQVTLLAVALPGDFNGDNQVDADDYTLWKQQFGSVGDFAADGNGDQVVDAADYTLWRNNLGAGVVGDDAALTASAVPE